VGQPPGGLGLLAAARLAHEIGMIVDGVGDRADDGVAMGLAGEEREVLADLEAGDGGGDGLEFAADFGGGVELEIEGVLMGRSAGQVDHDHRLVGGTDPGGGLGPEELGQGEPAHAERADAEERPTRYPVAVPVGGTLDGEHGEEVNREEAISAGAGSGPGPGRGS